MSGLNQTHFFNYMIFTICLIVFEKDLKKHIPIIYINVSLDTCRLKFKAFAKICLCQLFVVYYVKLTRYDV